MTVRYDIDPDHVAQCDKPIAACPLCAQAFDLRTPEDTAALAIVRGVPHP